MELKFENKYYSTDKMLSEYVHKVLCKELKLLGTIIAVVSLIMLFIVLFDNNYILAGVFGVCLFCSVFVVFFAPSLTLKQIKESSRHIHNNQKFEAIVQFGNAITISEGAFSLTVEYTQILKIYSLKYSYVLMFGKNNGIILSPDNFTIGTFEEFQSFIKSKCNLSK